MDTPPASVADSILVPLISAAPLAPLVYVAAATLARLIEIRPGTQNRSSGRPSGCSSRTRQARSKARWTRIGSGLEPLPLGMGGGQSPWRGLQPCAQGFVRAGEVLMNPETVHGEGCLQAQKSQAVPGFWLLMLTSSRRRLAIQPADTDQQKIRSPRNRTQAKRVCR